MNEVKLVVTGQNRTRSSLTAPKKELDDLGAAAKKASKTAEQALDDLNKKAGDAFSGIQEKMNKSFDDLDKRSREAAAKTVDRFKSSMDGLSGGSFDIDFNSKGIGEKLLSGLTSAIVKGKDLFAAGLEGGKSVVSGISEAVKGQHPYVQAALYGTLATAAVAVGPLVGGALAGGIVAGFGAGIAGLGILAAAQNNEVKATYRDLWGDLSGQAKKNSQVVADMLVRFSGRVKATFEDLEPAVRGSLTTLTPSLERFGDGMLKALGRFEPAIRPLAEAASAVFDDLSGRLPGIVGELADEFGELADQIKQNPEALGDFIAMAGELTEVALDVVGVLNFMWKAHKDLFDIATTPLEWLGLKDGEDAANGTAEGLGRIAKVSFDATDATASLDEAFKRLAESGADVQKAGQAIIDILDILSGRTPSYAEAQQGINDKIREMKDLFGDAKNHVDGYGSALLNADGTVNTMTKNGSALQDMMVDLQGEFANSVTAVSELERAGMSHDAAVAKVNSDLNTQRDRLIEVGRTMGLSKDEMNKLLDAYNMAPHDISTMIQLLGAQKAEGELNYVSRPREVAMWVRYYGTAAVGGTGGVVGGGPNRLFAHGGVSSGGWTTVGEMGPERVKLPPGAQVMPHTGSDQLRAAQGGDGGSGGGATVLELRALGNLSPLERMFFEFLQAAMRTGKLQMSGAS